MKLKRPLPPSRTLDQVRNHYLVEKAIADRLRQADRQERKGIYAGMYAELFRKVPDHPRLTRRESPELTRRAIQARLRLLRPFVDASTVLVEFAPGDCQFLVDVARRVRFAYGIDISDQRSPALPSPDNFRLIVYDGEDTREIADSSIDVVFSDQLIEHIAPDEAEAHFALAHRLLRPGGRYVFCTPHRLTGPHDVSAYFSDEPQGFHLKEWTYREIVPLLCRVGFARCQTYWTARGRTARLPLAYFTLCERVLGPLPRRLARPVCRALTPAILVAAEK